jgi:hypothetical protein
MNTQTGALLLKEWIKLRRGVWLLPLIVGYAATDATLILNTISRMHGPQGLWTTVISKQPPFFSMFVLLAACGILLGAMQAWPESQGKRLRLLFHTPIKPWRIVAAMAGTGCMVLILTCILALGLLALAMYAFHFPPEMIVPVLLSVLPWCMLSFTAYFSTLAFFCTPHFALKLLVLTCGFVAASLLAEVQAYGAYGPSLWQYALFAAGFAPMTYFALMRFLGSPQGDGFGPARGATLLLAACCLSAALPGFYWRMAMPERVRQSMSFSSVRGEFVTSSTALGKAIGPVGAGTTMYMLENGTKLNRKQYTQALPFLYAEDLAKWNCFPQTLGGRTFTPHEAKYSWQFARFSPQEWNSPAPMLHMLLESEPGGARLELAPDFFRVASDGLSIEFLRPEDGSVNQAKSKLFSDALRNVGFVFPVRALGGTPDPLKAYDLGYVLADAENTLFRLQMTHAAPRSLNTQQTVPGNIRSIIVQEHHRKEWGAFVVTDDAFFILDQQSATLRRLPLPFFDAGKTRIALWADPLGKSAVLWDLSGIHSGITGLGMDPNYKSVHDFTMPPNEDDLRTMDQRRLIASFLFPVKLSKYEAGSGFMHLSATYADVPLAAAASCALSLVLFLLLQRRMQRPLRLWDCSLIALFGPVALASIILADMDNKQNLFNKFR